MFVNEVKVWRIFDRASDSVAATVVGDAEIAALHGHFYAGGMTQLMLAERVQNQCLHYAEAQVRLSVGLGITGGARKGRLSQTFGHSRLPTRACGLPPGDHFRGQT